MSSVADEFLEGNGAEQHMFGSSQWFLNVTKHHNGQ